MHTKVKAFPTNGFFKKSKNKLNKFMKKKHNNRPTRSILVLVPLFKFLRTALQIAKVMNALAYF